MRLNDACSLSRDSLLVTILDFVNLIALLLDTVSALFVLFPSQKQLIMFEGGASHDPGESDAALVGRNCSTQPDMPMHVESIWSGFTDW